MESATATTCALDRAGSARLPTAFGEFTITVYQDSDLKEHLAIRMGDLEGPPALVRIHSECLTGDVFASVRCDCGEQLHLALQYIAREGRGLLLYLRQEGRGIGLNNKIRAYALQDQGMDTVDANLHLGFPADGRNYSHAAEILKDQGVHSVRLATNNPAKVKALESCGIDVVERVRYEIQPRPENHAYLQTKASKLGHLLNPWPAIVPNGGGLQTTQESPWSDRLRRAVEQRRPDGMPSVTLSYAQSLDGSIASKPGRPLQLSNPQSQALTHRLRSLHDAVLVGINTVLSDDPRLTARVAGGRNPQPVVLDGRLRLRLKSRLLHAPCVPPIVATTAQASALREKRLREAGAQVIRLPSQRNGLIDLRALLRKLYQLGIRSVMVEGGSQVITEFLACQLVDHMIITISPQVIGGLSAVTPLLPKMRSPARCRLTNVHYQSFAGDLVVYADVEKPVSKRTRTKQRIDAPLNAQSRSSKGRGIPS